jgi:hypothetical protein
MTQSMDYFANPAWSILLTLANKGRLDWRPSITGVKSSGAKRLLSSPTSRWLGRAATYGSAGRPPMPASFISKVSYCEGFRMTAIRDDAACTGAVVRKPSHKRGGDHHVHCSVQNLCRSATPDEVAIELGKKCHPQAAVRGLSSAVIQVDPLGGGSDFFAAADLR